MAALFGGPIAVAVASALTIIYRIYLGGATLLTGLAGFAMAAGMGLAWHFIAARRARCLCCERADQPMDDDGCGICVACLGLPVSTGRAPDTLECQASSSHLSLTTRDR